MNPSHAFLIQIALTATLSLLIVGYLRPSLRKVLIDLCGTEDRAHFWTAFSNILLIGLPIIISLNYKPQAGAGEEFFFEISSKLSGNLAGLLFALIGIGFIVTFFALVAPRPIKEEAK
jgi:uncharacterized membrane protein YhaH (DUF805 family)